MAKLYPDEEPVEVSDTIDAGLAFIGRIGTPWTSMRPPPRMGHPLGPVCRIEIFEPWHAALYGIEAYPKLEILYWLDRSRRDLVLQSPVGDGKLYGTFSLRSPVRPNPIGTSIVELDGRDGNILFVRGLDCFDGTPLLDIKPDRQLCKPLKPARDGISPEQ
jgi:tRNA-Thr(GGU) m(6)t(6)A37 methyltransferase TsaA